MAESRAAAMFREHYESSARFYGAEEPKKAATNARRAATGLQTTLTTFKSLLTPEQAEALSNAEDVLRRLADDLDQVSKMASHTKDAHDAATVKARLDAANNTAAARWADDAAMILEARHLADFIDLHHQLQVLEWVHLTKPMLANIRYVNMPDVVSPGGRLHDMLHRKTAVGLIRQRAAEYLQALREGTHRPKVYRDLYYADIADYEEWRAWRSTVMGAVRPPLT